VLFSSTVEEGRLFVSIVGFTIMPDILDQNQKNSSNDPATTPTQSDQGAGSSSVDPITPVTPGSPADAALPAAPVDISDLLRPGADAPKEEHIAAGDTLTPSSSVPASSDALPSEPVPAPPSDVAMPMDTNLVVPAASTEDTQAGAAGMPPYSGKPPNLSGKKFGPGNKRNLIMGLALLFLLLTTGGVLFFIDQQQDIRNRAADKDDRDVGSLYPTTASPTPLSGSFVAGTMIQTPQGDRAVEDMKTGDEVYTFDPMTGEVVVNVVDQPISYISNHYFNLKLENGTVLRVTGRHPLYFGPQYKSRHADELTGKPQHDGFEAVWHIEAGDTLFIRGSEEGPFTPVRVVGKEKVDGDIQVYNLQVAGHRTYFAEKIAVHNKSGYYAPLPGGVCRTGDTYIPATNQCMYGGFEGNACDQNTQCTSGFCDPATKTCKTKAGCQPAGYIAISDSYTCVALSGGTFYGCEGKKYCKLGTAPNGVTTCSQNSRPTCANDRITPICVGSSTGTFSWTCDIPDASSTPADGRQCIAGARRCCGASNSQVCNANGFWQAGGGLNCTGNSQEQNLATHCDTRPLDPSRAIGSCPAGYSWNSTTSKCVAGSLGLTCGAGTGKNLSFTPGNTGSAVSSDTVAQMRAVCAAVGGELQASGFTCSAATTSGCNTNGSYLSETNGGYSIPGGSCGSGQIDFGCKNATTGKLCTIGFVSYTAANNCTGGGSYSYSQGSYLTGNTPTPTRTPTPTSVVTGTPTPTSVVTGTPTPTSIYTPTPTQPGYAYSQGTYSTGYTPTPTTPLIACNGACTVNADCGGGNVCHNGACRNPSCADDADCDCNITLAYCNQACTVNTDCGSGLVCLDSVCRNPSCSDSASCSCGSTVAPTPKVPVAGVPSVIGMTTVVGAVFLLLLGLIL
jgi:hypothetical protein